MELQKKLQDEKDDDHITTDERAAENSNLRNEVEAARNNVEMLIGENAKMEKKMTLFKTS